MGILFNKTYRNNSVPLIYIKHSKNGRNTLKDTTILENEVENGKLTIKIDEYY